jgi:hypothetical protein
MRVEFFYPHFLTLSITNEPWSRVILILTQIVVCAHFVKVRPEPFHSDSNEP